MATMRPRALLGSHPRVQLVWQVARDSAKLPSDDLKIEGMEGFEQFEIMPLPEADACYFEKGQYIAKAWPSSTGEWQFFAARINAITKAGPYAHFQYDGLQQLQTDLSVENYGKLWLFMKKKGAVLAQEEAAQLEKEAKALARQAKKREREEALVALKAVRPERPRRDCAKPESKKAVEAQLRGTRLALKRQPRRMRDEEDDEDGEEDDEEDEDEEEDEEEEALFEEGNPGGDALAEEEEAAESEAEGKEE